MIRMILMAAAIVFISAALWTDCLAYLAIACACWIIGAVLHVVVLFGL